MRLCAALRGGSLLMSLLLSACGGGGDGAPAVTPKSWGVAQLIEFDDANAGSPQIAVDGAGNAIAVWTQLDGTFDSIWARRFSAVSGAWGLAEVIEIDDAGIASNPRIAFDGAGNAMAVWQQHDGMRNNIWANRYDAGSGTWSGAQTIVAADTDAVEPQVALDGAGNAMAVWAQGGEIRANRFSGGWGAMPLLVSSAGSTASPQVALDGAGNAFAVWKQFNAGFNIWANRFDAVDDTWGTAQGIQSEPGLAFDPRIAVDGAGNAFAVWPQEVSMQTSIWANRFDASSGTWSGAQTIEIDDGFASNPQIAFDGAGNALAVWQQLDGARNDIWANRFDAGSNSWGEAKLIETDDAGDAITPQIATDGSGNALAVWTQFDGAFSNILANRFDAGSGAWGTAQPIEENTSGAGDPQIAVDGAGNAIAVWRQSDGTSFNIWFNRYD